MASLSMVTRHSAFFNTLWAMATMIEESISEHARWPGIDTRPQNRMLRRLTRAMEGLYNALAQTASTRGTHPSMMM